MRFKKWSFTGAWLIMLNSANHLKEILSKNEMYRNNNFSLKQFLIWIVPHIMHLFYGKLYHWSLFILLLQVTYSKLKKKHHINHSFLSPIHLFIAHLKFVVLSFNKDISRKVYAKKIAQYFFFCKNIFIFTRISQII